MRVHGYIEEYWAERITELESSLADIAEEDDRIQQQMQLDWMKETQIAVMISEEQGEVNKFRNMGSGYPALPQTDQGRI